MWKTALRLAVWIYVFPPVGLWKLWKEPSFSAAAKWRILLYLCVIPLLLYLAISLTAVNHALDRLLG